MPTKLAARGVALSPEQVEDILICRVAILTGWNLEYVQALPLDWVGKLLSYENAVGELKNG